jgi:hypothetical protein
MLLLGGDGSTMAEPAEEVGVTPSRFSRIVRLGFLSPRVVTAIVDATRPLELSADRLLKAGPVSSTRSEQLATYEFVRTSSRIDRPHGSLRKRREFSFAVTHRPTGHEARCTEEPGSSDIGSPVCPGSRTESVSRVGVRMASRTSS